MYRISSAIMFVVAMLMASLPCVGQESAPAADNAADNSLGAKVHIGFAELALGGYAQTLYSYRHHDGRDANGFDVQRVILIANGRLTRELSAFVMFDAASGQLHEIYGQWAFSEGLKVRVGQFKQPYTLENLIQPTQLSAIEMDPSVLYMCGIATEPGIGAHTARDAGIMLTGDLLWRGGRRLLNYQVGVFNGTGRNVKENNNCKSVMGMLKYMPGREWVLAGSFAVGTSKAESGRLDYQGRPIFAQGENYHRLRLAAGGEYRCRYVSLRSEYMYGRDASVPMHGCYVNAEWHLMPRIDVVGNVDYLNRNARAHGYESQMTYIGGVQYWVYGHCRVLAEYVHTAPKSGSVSNALLVQFQIAF